MQKSLSRTGLCRPLVAIIILATLTGSSGEIVAAGEAALPGLQWDRSDGAAPEGFHLRRQGEGATIYGGRVELWGMQFDVLLRYEGSRLTDLYLSSESNYIYDPQEGLREFLAIAEEMQYWLNQIPVKLCASCDSIDPTELAAGRRVPLVEWSNERMNARLQLSHNHFSSTLGDQLRLFLSIERRG